MRRLLLDLCIIIALLKGVRAFGCVWGGRWKGYGEFRDDFSASSNIQRMFYLDFVRVSGRVLPTLAARFSRHDWRQTATHHHRHQQHRLCICPEPLHRWPVEKGWIHIQLIRRREHYGREPGDCG